MVWSHEEEEVLRFLDHLHSTHSRVQFGMEEKAHDKLVFPDVLVLKRAIKPLSHCV